MAIPDMYSSGAQKRNLGHFGNIVKLAMSDNVISENEQVVISRLKKKLQISDANYRKVLESPNSFPINPPANLNARLERLYNLVSLVLADGEVKEEEYNLLVKIAVGLGFPKEIVKRISTKAIGFVHDNMDLDDFIDEMKKIL